MSYVTGISNTINNAFINRGRILNGEAECVNIQIKGTYVIFQPDDETFKSEIINRLFTPGSQRRICDYVVVSDEVVLVCELKSNNVGNMKSQLKNTGLLIKYLLEMVREHNKINLQVPPIKYVCFSKKYSNNKQQAIMNKLNGVHWNDSELFQLSCSFIYHLNQFN